MSNQKQSRFEVNRRALADRTEPLSNRAPLICVHMVGFMLGETEERLYLHRVGGEAELWAVNEFTEEGQCIVLDREPPEDDRGASLELLRVRVKAWLGHEYPTEFIAAGILSKQDHEAVLAEIQAEKAEVKRQAEEFRKTPIIQAATELGLNPDPSTSHPDNWWCNCPGTNHRLMVVPSTGQFGCGYCMVKGGVEELKKFVKKRRAQVSRRMARAAGKVTS